MWFAPVPNYVLIVRIEKRNENFRIVQWRIYDNNVNIFHIEDVLFSMSDPPPKKNESEISWSSTDHVHRAVLN